MSAIVLGAASSAEAQTRWHVNASGGTGSPCMPAGQGLCWDDPFLTLQDALLNPSLMFGDEIWVAAGVYYPTPPAATGADETISHVIPNGVSVFGGFNATETVFDQRAELFATTVLSGDIETSAPGLSPGDSNTIVTFGDNGESARLDGFTIRHGYADTAGGTNNLAQFGAGVAVLAVTGAPTPPPMLAHLTIHDCEARNGGAGVYAAPDSRFDAKYCTIHTCEAGEPPSGLSLGVRGQGAGIHINQSLAVRLHSLQVYGCRALDGAGIFINLGNREALVETQNLLLRDNYGNQGGAIQVRNDRNGGQTEFINTTFAYNNTQDQVGLTGGGTAIWYQTTPGAGGANWVRRVRNGILWQNRHATSGGALSINTIAGPGAAFNVQVEYCDVEVAGGGTYPGTGNINADPLFVDPTLRALGLQITSPCIDAGNDTYLRVDALDLDDDANPIPEYVPLDNTRYDAREFDVTSVINTGVDAGNIVGAVVDMGAFERGTTTEPDL